MRLPPDELAARLEVLAQNILAIEAYLVRLTSAVADTKRQLEELRTGQPAPPLPRLAQLGSDPPAQ